MIEIQLILEMLIEIIDISCDIELDLIFCSINLTIKAIKAMMNNISIQFFTQFIIESFC